LIVSAVGVGEDAPRVHGVLDRLRVVRALHREHGARDVAEDRAVDTHAVRRERGERARHLERVHGLGAEPDREVGVETALHAQ
jgi:hypothetical protein